MLLCALSSTVLVTNGQSKQSDQRYAAYGKRRGGTPANLPTDHQFTGQKQDGTGLIYMNARYYDPQLGVFISPDTIVPDPTTIYDYNRYAYARLNPMKFIDPSGHCSGQPDPHDSAAMNEYNSCTNYVQMILLGWDKTDYFSKMWPDQEDFIEAVAWNPGFDSKAVHRLFDQFQQSQEYKDWSAKQPHYNGPDLSSGNDPNDPMCGGEKLCQNVVGVAEKAGEKCDQMDCVGIASDVVGVAGAGLMVASPLCGPAALGCASAGASIGGASAVVGVLNTGYRWKNHQATTQDLVVTVITGVGGVGTTSKVGAAAYAGVQLYWDMVLSAQVSPSAR